MIKNVSIFVFILFLAFPVQAIADGHVIYLTGVQSTESNFRQLVKEKGGDPLKITNFESPFASRPVVAMLILHQALALGGLNAELEFISTPNLSRCISEVKRGKIPLLATDIWEEDFDDSVYKTAPFVKKGDFEKGIYTYEGSELLKQKIDLNTLLQLVPLTEMSWTQDLNLLKKMGFQKITTAPRYELLLKMLQKKRADFVLLEFGKNRDMTYHDPELNAYPVNGVKIVFPNSRHFMVSKLHPDGKKFTKPLNADLKYCVKTAQFKKPCISP